MSPVAPVVEVIVKEMVGEKAQGDIDHQQVEDAIKEAVKDAIRDVVEVVVEKNGVHRPEVEP
jgi:D-aminopeptidase